MTIRAIVFRSKTTAKKLTKSLKGVGGRMVSLTELPQVIAPLKQEAFDLVLIDSLAEQAVGVCHYIREFAAIPLVLIVHEGRTDWKGGQVMLARFRGDQNHSNIVEKSD